jgi:tripartite-type tricarboxylate transporter receptor subunit TctC
VIPGLRPLGDPGFVDKLGEIDLAATSPFVSGTGDDHQFLIEERLHPQIIGSTSIDYINAGRLTALAVTTAARSEKLPELPTVGDFLPGFEASAFFGIGAPKGTPSEVIDRLNEEINAGLADPGIKARLAELAGPALPGSPADFGKLIADETDKWGRVIEFAGIKQG